MCLSNSRRDRWTRLGRVRGLSVIASALALCIMCAPLAHANGVIPQPSDDQNKNHWVVPVVIIGAVVAIWYLMYPPATPTPLTPPGLLPGM
jgi:hypothetical protein